MAIFVMVHAGVDRSLEWRACCASILGWNFPYTNDDNNNNNNNNNKTTKPPHAVRSRTDITLVNLATSDHDDTADSVTNRRKPKEKPTGNANNNNNDDSGFFEQAIGEIRENMDRMVKWMAEKQWTYESPETTNEEASLIQSTIGNFTVTTANELEHLRRLYQQQQQQQQQQQDCLYREQRQQHDMAIIQILSERLKKVIAEPLGQWQKKRQRAAVQLWQSPLQCCHIMDDRTAKMLIMVEPEKKDEDELMDRLLGLDSDDDVDNSKQGLETNVGMIRNNNRCRRRRRQVVGSFFFLPKQTATTRQEVDCRTNHDYSNDFLNSYAAATSTLPPLPWKPPNTFLSKPMGGSKRPRSPTVLKHGTVVHETTTTTTTTTAEKNHNKRSKGPHQVVAAAAADDDDDDDDDDADDDAFLYLAVDEQELQQEATQLQLQHQLQHQELDAVQSLEVTMVQITQLLSQFSELVGTQQEDVALIQQNVSASKLNMDQGQEQLVDAQQRSEQSKHYMATAIAVMATAMLFFHWIRP